MPTFILELRFHFIPWHVPTIPLVVQSLKCQFPTDSGLTVIPGRNKELGQYRVVIPTANADADVTVPLKVEGRDYNFVMKPAATQTTFAGVSNKQLSDGTLYTLYDCTQGPWADVTNSVFDDCVRSLGKLTKLTEHQKFRGSSVFNGNRYFCLVPSGEMPDSIMVPDPADPALTHKVRLGYKGKTYFCSRCSAKHIGPCPAKK